ncbi:glycosyltransferase family 1 protein, partial [Herbaspirillum sp. RU 5E]|nr:glycosyltransferase family 1 protein [Herbaspirillum sp. RU 5E]
PLAWQPGLASADVPVLELPAVPAAALPARQDLVARQLDDFILASQRRLNATPAAAALTPPRAPGRRKKRRGVYSVESTWSPCPQIRL